MGEQRRMRVVAVDAARGFAIVSMVVAHTVAWVRGALPRPAEVIAGAMNDVAAPLFTLIIGVSIAIISRGHESWPPSRRWRFRGQLALKALVLIALGVALEFSYSGVNVVLDYLGAVLLLSLPLVFAPARVLLAVATALLALGPTLNRLATQAWPMGRSQLPPVLGDVAEWTVLTGSYPATWLLPMLLGGVVLGRGGLGKPRINASMAVTGIALTILALPWVDRDVASGVTLMSHSHGQMVRELGLTIAVMGLIGLLVDSTSPRVSALTQAVATPVTAMGRMSLSVYVLHVLVLMALWASPLAEPWFRGSAGGYLVMAGLLALCAGFAMAWGRFLGAGPIERVIGVVSLRHPPSWLLWAPHRASSRA